MDSRHAVIVIGGGLSGLSTANLLHDCGIDVLVLEASNRVGGRLLTIHNEKFGDIDLGGAYIGPTQDRVYRMARDLGINTRDVYSKKDIVCYRKGKSTRFRGLLPPMGSVSDMLDSNYLLRRIHELCEEIPVDEPWNAPNAEYLDRMSFQEWLRETVSSETARDDARMLLRLNMTAEPYEVSLLWTLWYIKSAGGMERMNAFKGGAQEKTFVGGSQQLPIGLMKKFPEKVLTSTPVNRILQHENGVTVYAANGAKFEADYVVLAMPPSAHLKIVFEPALPTLRNQLLQRVPLGSVIKTMTFYDRPYWHETGYCGTSFIEDEDEDFPVISTIDSSKPEAGQYCLMGFIAGEKARLVMSMSVEERMKSVAEEYAIVFDCEELKTPIHYEEKNWCEDPWAGGCYTGIMAPGILSTYGSVLRKPIGRLYFAGTETATVWSGYMDGAIQGGERAAREILHEMGRCSAKEIFQEEPANEDFPAPEFHPSLAQKYLPSKRQLFESVAAVGAVAACAVGGLHVWSKL